MTKREFLNAVINGTMNDETKEFATKELAQIDAQLEKKRTTLTPKQEANLELAEQVFAHLSDKAITANDVYALGIDGITSIPKASSLLRMLVANGRAVSADVKVGNKLQKGYTRAE